MEILILGSGTSHGVPMIGCECAVCRSDNPKNKRFRPSILVRNAEHSILVDTAPELRLQALANDVRRVDAVLFTHTHADHIFGMDDLRRFNDLVGGEIPIYGDPQTLDDIRRIFRYVFIETQAGGGKPRLILHTIPPAFDLFGLHIQAFYVMHGRLPVLSFRFDRPAIADTPARSAAYVTDVNLIPPDSMAKLQDLDLLILDAVRFEPHSTHFGLYQALDVIAELRPRQALLTHISHHFDHDAVNAQLPSNVALAYDGQRIAFF
ncbi:MAG TPA: MBL fold metallo-hydrolase [Chthonomonadaceae bacterium]|nr:MBL fold metallo-hydrolase [Chthonomonadaceae bacterium]